VIHSQPVNPLLVSHNRYVVRRAQGSISVPVKLTNFVLGFLLVHAGAQPLGPTMRGACALDDFLRGRAPAKDLDIRPNRVNIDADALLILTLLRRVG
jgi:hypothetical protein